MSFTVQQVVDLARAPLNDALKKRYTDAVLLGYYNSAIQRLYEIRPDLLIGTGWGPFTGVDIGSIGSATLPVGDRFAQTVADYIGGRAEMKDEDAASSGRASTLLQIFVAELTQ